MIRDVCMVHKNVDQSENLAVKNRHMETGSLLQEQELQSLNIGIETSTLCNVAVTTFIPQERYTQKMNSRFLRGKNILCNLKLITSFEGKT